MNSALVKAVIAELLGTFILVFVGVAAVTVAPLASSGVIVPALAHGLIVIGLIFAFGHLSGGQFNPAVTLALIVGGKESLGRGLLFMGVQFLGGIIAALLLVNLIPEQFQIIPEGREVWNSGLAIGSMTTVGGMWWSAVLEGLQAFIFVSVIYQVAVHGRAGTLAPLAIGFTLTALIVSFGIYTGASVNPARTLGPALVAGSMTHVVPYFVGLFVGGAAAGLVNAYLLTPNVEKA